MKEFGNCAQKDRFLIFASQALILAAGAQEPPSLVSEGALPSSSVHRSLYTWPTSLFIVCTGSLCPLSFCENSDDKPFNTRALFTNERTSWEPCIHMYTHGGALFRGCWRTGTVCSTRVSPGKWLRSGVSCSSADQLGLLSGEKWRCQNTAIFFLQKMRLFINCN